MSMKFLKTILWQQEKVSKIKKKKNNSYARHTCEKQEGSFTKNQYTVNFK
jgi:hypothetical protein